MSYLTYAQVVPLGPELTMRRPAISRALSAWVIGAVMACSRAAPHPESTMLTAEEQRAGWRLLFDGKTVAGWRGFKSDTLPARWQPVDGALTRVAQAGDIVTDQQFQDFELTLEWMVAPGATAGSFTG